MAKKSTIKLLLINESDNESERLISLFRNAGRVARAERANSVEQLHKILKKKSWDLLIANDRHPEITVEQCLEQLTKASTPVPAIVIRDHEAQAALEAGARDVIASGDDARLIAAAFRELTSLEQYRQLEKTRAKLEEAEQRSALLLEQSQDAIAYVADGMVINANLLFAQRFGYTDGDDLDCTPIIDLIDTVDHDSFKVNLKAQLALDEGSTDFNFQGQTLAGDSFTAKLQLCNAVFDDEPCIQLTIKDQQAPTGEAVADIDSATGLASKTHFLTQLELYSNRLTAGNDKVAEGGALAFIAIDGFYNLRANKGISNASSLLRAIVPIISQYRPANSYLSHFSDDGFSLLLTDISAKDADSYAQQMVKNLAENTIEFDEQAVPCTVSIGLVRIDQQTQGQADELIDQAFICAEQQRSQGGNGVASHVQERKQPALDSDVSDEELDHFLAEALEDERFSLQFQPVVSLRGSSGDHYEVQAMISNDDGQAPASQLLNTLQFSNSNTRFDRWLIIAATKLLAEQLRENQDIRLFINLTCHALRDESLITWLNVALKAGGIPAGKLAFQFTEADISNDLAAAKIFAKAIHGAGCKLSIAEFGQADNAIANVQALAAEFTQVSSALSNSLQDEEANQRLKTLIAGINENNAQAIINHVENAAALAQLWQLGVDYIQGDYMASASPEMNYEFTDIT